MSAAMPAISAHRGGGEIARAGTWEAFRAALDASGEYVEFDVRRTRDGTWVIYHDEHVGLRRRPVRTLHRDELSELVGYPVPEATAVMEVLAKRVIGHLDLKEQGREEEIVGTAIEIFGADGFVATTENAASIRRIRAFAPSVRTALSTGNPRLARSQRVGPRLRHRRFDLSTVVDSGANWVALNHRLASDKVLKQCRRHNIGVMLWTVNAPDLIARHLTDCRIDVLITDRPKYAIGVRARLAATRTPGCVPHVQPAECGSSAPRSTISPLNVGPGRPQPG